MTPRFQDRVAEEENNYIGRFLKLSAAVEKRLLQAIVTLLALLAIFQALLAIDGVRERISPVDRLEGRPTAFAPQPDHVLY
ncbi:hypothetical protein [Paenibacillus sp.]|uniref:hypothetical protein n=1 Tax=Paenibacillus sp. TaxID=58172 RepID=UPI002D7305F4|nr:hypothetical protein [Paenibacillus sp.]HZG85219.1 hypothetical protein [Paenibacillus sp.]